MLISAELATANIEMNGKIAPIGRFGAPVCTTSSSGVAPSFDNSPGGTNATADIDTST